MDTFSAKMFKEIMIVSGYYLKMNAQKVNDLNVFPVPDGDTGSNMLQTFLKGLERIKDIEDVTLATMAHEFATGLLFGARGNSGVILSQIFAGLDSGVHDVESIHVSELLNALNESKKSAYKSVLVPVEGTILTVIKDATEYVLKNRNKYNHVHEVFKDYRGEVHASLNRTPLLLPVLKEAGVVDSGGAGLAFIVDGICAYYDGERHTIDEVLQNNNDHHQSSAADFADYSFYDLNQYGYCTEFTIKLNPNIEFNKEDFTKKLEMFGYSIVVVNTEFIVKAHIHTKTPGDVFTFAQRYGALCAVKAENMAIQTKENSSIVVSKVKVQSKLSEETKKTGVVAVVNGEGLEQTFRDFGVDEIINGGQTMNPSTQDFIDAIKNVNAEHVFVIPNNKNVYMSAKAAKALINDKHVIVIPAKTISQGYAAMMCYDESISPKEIVAAMEEKIESIQSGEITYAIRNSISSGIEIRKDDFIAVLDGTIINSVRSRIESTKDLIHTMLKDETMSVTVFYGEDVDNDELQSLEEYFTNYREDVFFQFINGGQKIYSYIVEVE